MSNKQDPRKRRDTFNYAEATPRSVQRPIQARKPFIPPPLKPFAPPSVKPTIKPVIIEPVKPMEIIINREDRSIPQMQSELRKDSVEKTAQSRFQYFYDRVKEYAPSAAVLAGLLALAYASSPETIKSATNMLEQEIKNPGTFTAEEMNKQLETMSDKYDQLAKDVYKEVTSEPPVKQLFKGYHAPTVETHKPYVAPSQEKIVTIGNDQYKLKYA